MELKKQLLLKIELLLIIVKKSTNEKYNVIVTERRKKDCKVSNNVVKANANENIMQSRLKDRKRIVEAHIL